MSGRPIPATDLETIMQALLEAVAVLDPGMSLAVHACPHLVSVTVDRDQMPEVCALCGADPNMRVYLRGWPF